MPAYYSGRDGDPFTDAVMHEDRDCPALEASDGSARPVADATVALLDAVAWCPECSGETLATVEVNVDEIADEIAAELIEDGECPWCDDYSGGHVGQHASSAHPKKWSDYKDD